jgi:hypothetical protein
MKQSPSNLNELFDFLTLAYGIFGFLTLIILPGIVSRDEYHPGLTKAWIVSGATLCLMVAYRGEYLFPAVVAIIIFGIFIAQKRK